MNGKICMVTGANTGIGKETALGLAKLGATVVMVCRDQSKGEAAKSEIKAKSGNESVGLMIADFSSQRSIRQLAKDFQSRYFHLHVLVNNAGLSLSQRTVTEDGLETTFAVNHLGSFLLTNLLLDVLKASAPARIVNVASQAHQRATLNFDDFQGEQQYSGLQAYCQSKLANILFTYELARRLNGTDVTVNCLHPGVVATHLISNYFASLWLRPLYWVMRPFFVTPEQGAQTSIYLASSPEMEGVTGKYFVNKKEAESSQESYNEEIAEKLWQISEELTSS
jgi:NAD(P)-dependent dehydrogenase (short-subunit alcohol dehydrogenase family)